MRDKIISRSSAEQPVTLRTLVHEISALPQSQQDDVMNRPLAMWPYWGPDGGPLHPVKRMFGYGKWSVLAMGGTNHPEGEPEQQPDAKDTNVEKVDLGVRWEAANLDGTDPELMAIGVLVRGLAPLDRAARKRVLEYLFARTGSE